VRVKIGQGPSGDICWSGSRNGAEMSRSSRASGGAPCCEALKVVTKAPKAKIKGQGPIMRRSGATGGRRLDARILSFAAFILALTGCTPQPSPDTWNQFIRKDDYQIDSERCRAIAKSTQSSPEEVRAMMSLPYGIGSEAGLEEGSYQICMLATGKYPWMDSRPSHAEVDAVRQRAEAAALVDLAKDDPARLPDLIRATPIQANVRALGFMIEQAQMCGIPTRPLEDAIEAVMAKHSVWRSLDLASGRDMRRQSRTFSIDDCIGLPKLISIETTSLRELSKR
jgi:hypothetical protein